jgi:hypothetical protein
MLFSQSVENVPSHSRLSLCALVALVVFTLAVFVAGCGSSPKGAQNQSTASGVSASPAATSSGTTTASGSGNSNGAASSDGSGSSSGSASNGGSESSSGSASSSGSGSGSGSGSASGGGAGTSSGAGSTSTPAAGGAITLANVQTQAGNWQSWGQIWPQYTNCVAPCDQSTWQQDYGVQNPSLSGNATEYQMTANQSGADVLFTAGLIGNGSAQNPDADHQLLPSLHNFTYDTDFYVADPSVTRALEFDISLWMDGTAGMTFGTQCDYLGDGEWDIFNNQTNQWVPTGSPCQFHNGWNHVEIELQRQSDNSTLYRSITLNGQTYQINQSFPAAQAPSGWWGLAANYQIDSEYPGTPVTTYLDNLAITYQ